MKTNQRIPEGRNDSLIPEKISAREVVRFAEALQFADVMTRWFGIIREQYQMVVQ